MLTNEVANPGRLTSSRRPNGALRHLLAESQWTEEQCARAVNQAAAEAGLCTGFDRSAISHWLAGRRPRPPVPALLAEAFSRKLGRTITKAAIGMGEAPASSDSGWQGGDAGLRSDDASVALRRLATSADRVQAVEPYSTSTRSLHVSFPPPHATAPAIVSAEHIAAVEVIARMYAVVDTRLGGGSARKALSAYLAYSVEPMLATSAKPALRRRLLEIAAQMTCLCGFMNFDDVYNGRAQRYYTLSLSLAAAAGSPTYRAITLGAMSVQAIHLGHHREGVELAEAAIADGHIANPAGNSFLHAQLAVAYASERDRAAAFKNLAAAERYLQDPHCATVGIFGAYHPAALARDEALVKAQLGNLNGAIAALSNSIKLRPPDERRSLAVTLTLLADCQLRRGLLDDAVGSCHRFLDITPRPASRRADQGFDRLLGQLRAFKRNRNAEILLQRAVSSRNAKPAS